MLGLAHRHLGILEGMGKYLSDYKAIRNLIITKECCYSLLIDYKSDSFPALFRAISLGKEETNNVLNIISAYLNQSTHFANSTFFN